MENMSGPSRAPAGAGKVIVDYKIQHDQLFAACFMLSAAMILLAAGLADAVWHARAASEMLGSPGLCLLSAALVCLIRSGAFDDLKSTVDHPLRDHWLDG
jgi:hypothetical protein